MLLLYDVTWFGQNTATTGTFNIITVSNSVTRRFIILLLHEVWCLVYGVSVWKAAEITSGVKTGSGSSRVAYISSCIISRTVNILPGRGGTGFQVKTQLRIVLNKTVIATLPLHSKKETQSPLWPLRNTPSLSAPTKSFLKGKKYI